MAGSHAPTADKQADNVNCVFLPLWEVQKNALTAYLCLPEEGATPTTGLARDLRVLSIAAAQLQSLAADGRKCVIVCPVSHTTLFHRSSFDRYIAGCAEIVPEHRELLSFLVTGIREDLMHLNGGWFLSELRAWSRGVFAEIVPHLGSTPGFLKRYKFDAIGCRLGLAGGDQKLAFDMIHACALAAQAAGVPGTFALDVDTLSLATVAACNGFGYLGGKAVQAPDSMYRYHTENLLSKILQ